VENAIDLEEEEQRRVERAIKGVMGQDRRDSARWGE